MAFNKKYRMKQLIMGGMLMVIGLAASAQFTTEMLDQIAALQAYLQVAEKGYHIVEQGLQTIGEIKNGELNLHSAFYSSLQAVSPTVANMAEVAEIIDLEASMISQFSRKLSGYRASGWLQPGEISYISQLYTGIVSSGVELLAALTSLTTDGALSLSDGERMSRIQQLDMDTKRQYRLVQTFTNQTDLLTLQRQQEGNDISTLKGIYGIQ
jgi:hypothetical protein